MSGVKVCLRYYLVPSIYFLSILSLFQFLGSLFKISQTWWLVPGFNIEKSSTTYHVKHTRTHTHSWPKKSEIQAASTNFCPDRLWVLAPRCPFSLHSGPARTWSEHKWMQTTKLTLQPRRMTLADTFPTSVDKHIGGKINIPPRHEKSTHCTSRPSQMLPYTPPFQRNQPQVPNMIWSYTATASLGVSNPPNYIYRFYEFYVMLLGSWSSWKTSMFLQVPSLQLSHKAGVSERSAATTTRRRGTAAPMRSRVALAWPGCFIPAEMPSFVNPTILKHRHRPNWDDNQTCTWCICLHTLCTANFPNFFKHAIRVAVGFLPVNRCCFAEHTTTYKKQLNPYYDAPLPETLWSPQQNGLARTPTSSG